MSSTLAKQLAVVQLSPGEFVSEEVPGAYGNAGGIAYGGCALGVATRAAHATVPEARYSLYSLVGQFLGPASTKSKLYCTVEKTRDTRTFATRRVVVKQRQADGTTRSCLDVLADFHVTEPALLTYSARPVLNYSGPAESSTIPELIQTALAKGLLEKDPRAESPARQFHAYDECLEIRVCPEGVEAQNLISILPGRPTDQDGRHVTARTSAEWVRSRGPLASAGEKAAVFAWIADGISGTATTHSKIGYGDVGAALTMDFALRMFAPEADLGKWLLREKKSPAAGVGRTYSESMWWDEQGNLVASMTQQCILRPSSQARAKAML